MPAKYITLGLSVHRPEMAPLLADMMRQHDAILLEEPPAEGFEQMLQGTLGVDEYLREQDVEYPAFSRDMCYQLRRLRSEGKKIYQVEPYLEVLIGIHEFFAEGHRPEELDQKSLQYPVYLAERNATGALLTYYQTVMSETFEASIKAIIKFARLDAARFRLRDSLRAQALVPLIKNYSSVFIEAGLMHYPLWRLLRRQLPRSHRVRLEFVADTALQKLDGKGHLFGPGDLLTLLYIFHSTFARPQREALLAARSLIYSKLVTKEESTENLNSMPHLRDELTCIQMARRLSIDDCQRLFPLVRKATRLDARQIVNDFLAQ